MSEIENSSFGPFAILAEGTRVGRYRVVSQLGSGGMGDVYLAEDIELDRQVALKFISPTLGLDHNSKTRFVREAQAAAKLNHPNIVTIHEVGEFNGLPFIAMEYVEGQSLKSLIEKEDLPIERVLDISLQLCRGLGAAHSSGIVHRDIKPNNILINNDGLCKILDFGLAMMQGTDSLTKTGSTLGTVNYMSPEQVLGKEVDVRSDIFSFGVVLYEMLTGALPFHGDMEAIVMYAIANEKADPLTKHKPDIPDDLQAIVDKALQKSPEDRYQTISEMATDLASLKDGTSEGQLIARASKPSKAVLSLKRKIIYPAMATLIIAAAITLFFTYPFKSSTARLKRVVIVPFKNQTGNAALDPLGRMVADWTTQGLAQSGMVETVPLEKVPDLEKKESIKDVVSATGANIIVMGSYYQLGDSIQFQAKIVDKDDKLLQAIDPINSLSEKAMDGVEGVRQKVMGTLAMLSEQKFGRLYSKPPIYEAYLQYIQGLDIFGGKTDKGVTDWASSIRYFEMAYSLDSSFFSPLFLIFAAHVNLAQIAQADSVLQFLTIRRDHLSQMEKLDLEEYRCIISGDAIKALNVARERAKIAPGTGTYYLWGRAAFMAHRPRECIQVLKRIDSEDSLAGIYTWIFLCDAFHLIGDYNDALKTARLGRRLYPASSNFLIHEIRDLAALGKVANLRKVLEEAAEYDQGRDIGNNMLNAAQDLRVHGHEDSAMAIYNEAIRWFEGLSPDEMTLNRLIYGTALYGARRWQQALEIFEELDRRLTDSLDPPEEILTARIWIGTTAARLGDRHRALEISEWLGNIKQTYRNGGPSYNRACIAAILGDKERAVNLLRESAAQGYFALGRWMITDWDFDLESLRDYPPFKEFIKPKG